MASSSTSPVHLASSSSEHDTTGGMAGKVAEAVAVAAGGIPVVIAEAGTEDGRLAMFMHPRDLRQQQGRGEWKGTIVRSS